MGKKGEHGMVADSRRADLSILKTADLLGFSHTANCGVHRQGPGKENTSGEQQFSERKSLVNVRGQMRMTRLLKVDTNSNNHLFTTKACRRASLSGMRCNGCKSIILI